MEKEFEKKLRRQVILQKVFTPTAPVSRKALFAGRHEQIARALGIVQQRGQHGIVYGDRGVGKTSLVSVLHYFYPQQLFDPDDPGGIETPRVNCNGGHTFSSLWREIFERIPLFRQKQSPGFTAEKQTELASVASAYLESDEQITPSKVESLLSHASVERQLIVIIDEFDRLPNNGVRRMMADTIKTLSDHSTGATLLLVGVADTVDELLVEHRSIERALVQIQMPRMSQPELAEIVTTGLRNFNHLCRDWQLEMEEEAVRLICFLSRGLPQYPHLLALNAAIEAVEESQSRIAAQQVWTGVQNALKDDQQGMLATYQKAISSAHKENLFAHVLTACALTVTDPLGYFSAASVRAPMSTIAKKDNVPISKYLKHLHEFCEPKRGSILQKQGDARNYRFRFRDALIEPYVIMRGFQDGILDRREFIPS